MEFKVKLAHALARLVDDGEIFQFVVVNEFFADNKAFVGNGKADGIRLTAVVQHGNHGREHDDNDKQEVGAPERVQQNDDRYDCGDDIPGFAALVFFVLGHDPACQNIVGGKWRFLRRHRLDDRGIILIYYSIA